MISIQMFESFTVNILYVARTVDNIWCKIVFQQVGMDLNECFSEVPILIYMKDIKQ